MKRRQFLSGVAISIAAAAAAPTVTAQENDEFEAFVSERQETDIEVVSHCFCPDTSSLIITTDGERVTDPTFHEEIEIVTERYTAYVADASAPPDRGVLVEVHESVADAEERSMRVWGAFASYELRADWAEDAAETGDLDLFTERTMATVYPRIEEDEEPERGYVDERAEQVILEYGETASISNGVRVTAHGIEFEDQLAGELPEERDRFALVQLAARNESNDERTLPQRTHPGIHLLFEDQQIERTINAAAFRDPAYDPYEGDDVQPGVRREGYILFEVPAGLDETEIDFLWQDTLYVTPDGEIDVRWTAER